MIFRIYGKVKKYSCCFLINNSLIAHSVCCGEFHNKKTFIIGGMFFYEFEYNIKGCPLD